MKKQKVQKRKKNRNKNRKEKLEYSKEKIIFTNLFKKMYMAAPTHSQ